MSKSKHTAWGTATIRIRETGEEQYVEFNGIEFEWVWDEISREAAEYWAVCDAVSETFGNNIDWFSVTAWGSKPGVKV